MHFYYLRNQTEDPIAQIKTLNVSLQNKIIQHKPLISLNLFHSQITTFKIKIK
jgi:hypothetical protein